MLKISIFIFSIQIGLIFASSESLEIIAETENGQIKGKIHPNEYVMFHSVPYAEPPINELRFEPPQLIRKNWTDIRDGTEYAPVCMQWSHLLEERLTGVEDCLYMNIFTPNIKPGELYPVIIYIHGGAFQYGSPNIFGVDPIMKTKEVVVVSIAYRLGPLGFLTTGDSEITGNLGLKDQRFALEWIRRNIRNFGGDPAQMQLIGFSAGGASVHLHLSRQDTEDFIKSAVSFSGTAFNPWVFDFNPYGKLKKLSELVNCPFGNTTVLKKCLKEKPAEDLVKTIGEFQFAFYYPYTIFGVVLEPDDVEGGFITDVLETIIVKRKMANIPWLVSYTPDDGGYNAADLLHRLPDGTEYVETFYENFYELAPKALFYADSFTKTEAREYSKLLLDKYDIYDEHTNMEKYFKFQKMFSDELFINGVMRTISMHKDFGDAPVYAYTYDNPSDKGVGNWISHRDDVNFGCVHGDDVFLMLPLMPAKELTPLRDDEKELSKKFVDMLITFAKTGVPKFGDLVFEANKKGEEAKFLKITKDGATNEQLKSEKDEL